ncbi:MAG: LamG domain-containing protein [Planctomycetota bacterium]|nr:MAG: LamG domain-containing protein [Planctomycetota bacterium]
MSKRFLFVICFVLVLGISSAGRADPIDVNNPSFELGSDGNKVPGHAGLGIGWKENADYATGYVGVDVQCPWANSTHCHRWPGPTETGSGTDVVYAYIAQTGANAYQVLDTNTSGDPNAVIAAGRRYTLTFDAIVEDPEDHGNPVKGSLFYPDDVNFPEENHVELESETYSVQWVLRDLGDCEGESILDSDAHCPDWNYDLTVKCVVLEGASSIGKTLGVKLVSPSLVQEAYAFVDNVRLDWDYATIAYDPNPADGAELITKNPTLTWKPGVWADQHEVYFGTDETAVANADNTDTTGIYKSTQDPCSYTPSGPLVLGETYYWKITEVNTGYVGPLTPPWEGEVWSFRVEGHAYDPSPANGERDVVFLGLDLEWSAGAEAENHMVYLGTDETAVANATTSSPEYKTTLAAGTESYAVGGQLTAGVTYYWRIDEKSGGSTHLITGDVWRFTAGTFLVVDDFQSYANNAELYTVWDDYWVNGSDGEMFLETDVNIIRESGSQAAELRFDNSSKGLPGSQFDVQDMTEVDIGSDWTAGGVKSLFMYLRGDPCNAHATDKDGKAPWEPMWESAQPWVELEDTSSNVGYVLHPRPEMAGYDGWFEWQIDLGIFDACGVTLSAIDRFTIGIGGADKTGQTKAMTAYGYLYVDDIRLYPPQCRPDLGALVGDFTEDCNVDGKDLKVIADDWLLRDGEQPTGNRPATLTNFPDETSHWTTDCAVGTGAIKVCDGCNIDVTDPRLNGQASMSLTAWIKPIVGMERWVGIVGSRESVGCGDDASEIGVYGAEYGGPDGLGYDWSCGTEEWKWDAGLDITDNVWTFVAVSVDPCGATLYKREAGGALQTGTRNVVAHALQQNFSQRFWIGRAKGSGGYFQGTIDDVRIYAYALTEADVNGLSDQTADPNPAPVYRYEFDETTGYTAADSGTPTIVYGPVPSVANLTDPEPKLQRFLNFADYAIFAENWMEQLMWPDW